MIRIILCFLLSISYVFGQTNSPSLIWNKLPPLPDSLGVAGAFVGVHHDVLIVGGGANFPDALPWKGGKKIYHKTIHVLTKNESDGYEWLKNKSINLPQEVGYGASISTPKGIVCIGGENSQGPLAKSFIIEWQAKQQTTSFKQLPNLPIPLTNHGIAYLGETIYIFGGSTDGINASQKAFSLDLSNSNPTWQTLPEMPIGTTHATVVTQSNGVKPCIYILGGRKLNTNHTTDIFNHTLCFDPVKKEWQFKTPIGGPNQLTEVAAATSVASGSNYILLFSGDEGNVFKKLENYTNQIAAEINESRKETLIQEKNAILEAHPGFSKKVYLYNTVTDVWTLADSISFHAPVTTTAIKWGDKFIIPSGEIRPGVRTPNMIEISTVNNQMFSWIDSLVLLICFLAMTVGRYLFTGNTDNTEDYFKGGKRIPQWAAAVSIFGAKLSAITFMGIPAKSYATNWTYFFYLMTIVMVMPFVAKYFIPFYRRLNVTSAYEYLGLRFNNGTRLIASSLFILLQLGRMGIVVLLPSIALTLVTGININICILAIGLISIFFTVKGGIEAVIWVEVIQVIILATGAIACLIYIPFQIQDWSTSIDALASAEKLKIFDLRLDFTEPTIWVVIIGGLAIHTLTYGTDQTTVQRYLTTKTEEESVNSLRIGAWLSVPSTIIFFGIGTMLYLFFRENPNQVNITLNNQDNIFPWYIVSQLPVGLSGLLIAGIFAASMSSTEASMNSTATLLTADFYTKWKKNATELENLYFARIATLLLGLFVTVIALYMAHQGVSSLWDKFNTILGLFTGCIGGAFILGIFTQKAHGTGVMIGMILSCIIQIFIQQYTQIHLLMYAFVGLTICITLGYLFSLILPNHSTKTNHKLTIYDIQK